MASPNNTTIPPAASIIDNSGAVWTLASGLGALASGSNVMRDGVFTYGYGYKLFWHDGDIIVENSPTTWWKWTGIGWAAASDPNGSITPPVITVGPPPPKFVSTSGSDTTGDGTIANPWQTVGHATPFLLPEDRLLARGGRYYENVAVGSGHASGISFSKAITVASYPGETAVMASINVNSARRFWIFQDLSVLNDAPDAVGVGVGGGELDGTGAGFCRFVNIDVSGYTGGASSGGGGVQFSVGGVGSNEWLGGRVHHISWPAPAIRPAPHGFYVSSPNNLVQGVEMDHIAQYAVHNFSGNPNGNRYINNHVHDCGTSGFLSGAFLISGNNNLVDHNVIEHNANGVILYDFGGSPTGNKVFYNSLYRNGNGRVSPGSNSYPAVYVGVSQVNAEVKNNLLFGNLGSSVDDHGTGSMVSNNPTADPMYVNADGGDFHLQSGSPAVNAGAYPGVIPLGTPPPPVIAPPPTGVAGLPTHIVQTPGWLTLPMNPPQGLVPAGSTVKLGNYPTQVNAKNFYPDGSLKLGWADIQATTTGALAPQVIPAVASAPFVPTTWPTGSVEFVIGGTTYIAAIPAFTNGDPWQSGPLVHESRALVTPFAGPVAHPLLQIAFDIRSFLGGGHRVSVCAQNIKDTAAGDNVTYESVTVRLNGQVVYTNANITHGYLLRWRKMFTTNPLVEGWASLDLESFYALGTIPRYLATVKDSMPVSTGPNFDILGFGDMYSDMWSPGGRPEIGTYPGWIVEWLTHRRPEQWAYMMKQADLSGSWPAHITESDGKTLISLDTYPDYWLDGRAGPHPSGPSCKRIASGGSSFIPAFGGGVFTNSHLPSLAFIPYLMTGDRYLLESLKFWANNTMLTTWPGDGQRQSGKGLLMQNESRGIGWALRALTETVWALPDADLDKPYFAARLQNNLTWLDTEAKTSDGGPLDLPFSQQIFKVDGPATVALWAMTYMAYAVDRAKQLGFSPADAFRNRVVKFQTRLFNSDPDYPKLYAGPYFIYVGTRTNGVRTYYSIKEVWDATYGPGSAPTVANPLAQQIPQPFNGYYGPEARMMLLMGVRDGMPGAAQALAYLDPVAVPDCNSRPQFALDTLGTFAGTVPPFVLPPVVVPPVVTSPVTPPVVDLPPAALASVAADVVALKTAVAALTTIANAPTKPADLKAMRDIVFSQPMSNDPNALTFEQVLKVLLASTKRMTLHPNDTPFVVPPDAIFVVTPE